MARSRGVVREGLVVGIIGYAAVALLYAALDLVTGRGALYTVDLLGKAFFRGLRDPAVLAGPIQLDVTAIALYNVFHLLAALAVGLIVTALVERVERRPEQAPTVLIVVVAGFVVTIVGVGLLTVEMRPVLPLWSIVACNSVAVIVAGLYLLSRRPGAWDLLVPVRDKGARRDQVSRKIQ